MDHIIDFAGSGSAFALHLTTKVLVDTVLRVAWVPLSHAVRLPESRFALIRHLVRDDQTLKTVLPKGLVGFKGSLDPEYVQTPPGACGVVVQHLDQRGPYGNRRLVVGAVVRQLTLEVPIMTNNDLLLPLLLPRLPAGLKSLCVDCSSYLTLRSLIQPCQTSIETLIWNGGSRMSVQQLASFITSDKLHCFPPGLKELEVQSSYESTPFPMAAVPNGVECLSIKGFSDFGRAPLSMENGKTTRFPNLRKLRVGVDSRVKLEVFIEQLPRPTLEVLRLFFFDRDQVDTTAIAEAWRLSSRRPYKDSEDTKLSPFPRLRVLEIHPSNTQCWFPGPILPVSLRMSPIEDLVCTDWHLFDAPVTGRIRGPHFGVLDKTLRRLQITLNWDPTSLRFPRNLQSLSLISDERIGFFGVGSITFPPRLLSLSICSIFSGSIRSEILPPKLHTLVLHRYMFLLGSPPPEFSGTWFDSEGVRHDQGRIVCSECRARHPSVMRRPQIRMALE